MFVGLLALTLAAVYAGAALYNNLVEQPARLSLDDDAMMAEWKPSDRRGFAFMGAVALLSAICGVAAFHDTLDVRWLAGAIVAIASWPYAFFVIVPFNNRLLAAGAAKGSPDARLLIRDWGVLAWGLSAIGVVATGTFLWALA